MNLRPLITLLLIFSFSFTATGQNEDEDNSTLSINNKLINGQSILNISSESQRISGIETTTLTEVQQQTEYIAYGKALSLQPLLEQQHRYLTAKNESDRAKTRFSQSLKNRIRQQDLFTYGATSRHKLQEQETLTQTDENLTNIGLIQERTLIYEAKLKWGKTISDWILSNDNKQFSDFLTGRQTLLQIYLPINKILSETCKTISVSSSGQRVQADIAELISAAPMSENSNHGLSYFFKTNSKKIQPEMTLTAWIPSLENQRGVIIPKSAILWIMEKAFIYLKLNETQFIRFPLTNYSETKGGYFIYKDLKPQQQIVTLGTETLLSEEMKGQIPEDN